jgi:predicted metal-dependent peptidase
MESHPLITQARSHMLLDSPWFGHLSMRLKIDSNPNIPTLQTDGTHLVYNAEYFEALPGKQRVGVLAHEVVHCALLHPYRRGQRDPKLWNRACDFAVNVILKDAGFELPSDVLYDPQYSGMSAEAIYAKLAREQQEQQDNGQPQPNEQGQDEQPLSTGTVEDAPPQPGPGEAQDADGQPQPGGQSQPSPDAPPEQMSEEDWKVAAEQATSAAKKAGNLPGDAVRATKSARQSTEDWRAILREFLEHTQPSDYTWESPNRRHIASGLYLPGIKKENLATIAVAIDTSGSIDQPMLDAFASELTAIVHEARPEAVKVVYCDTRIRHQEEFGPDDPEVILNAKGGGGTRFSPVFDHFGEQDEPPTCLLYFTDLDCYDIPDEPEYPVLWVTGVETTRTAPFGRTVHIDLHA